MTHLHRRSLHSRHAGQSIEDGDGDWNGNKEAANERPQVAPRLLSHHLDGKQQQQQQNLIGLDYVRLNFIDLCGDSRSMQQQESNRKPRRRQIRGNTGKEDNYCMTIC